MKKNILLLLICGVLSFGALNFVYAQQPTDNQSVIYAQIQMISNLINTLKAQIEKLRLGNGGNFATTTVTANSSEESKAKTALDDAKKLKTDLQNALMSEEDVEKAREGRIALDIAIKYLPSAERDYLAKRFLASYNMSSELKRSLEQALKKLKPGFTTTMCTMDAQICPDGSATYRSGPKCEFAACPSREVEPIACTMDAKLCPDGSSVGRSGPKCEFAACPINNFNPVACTMEVKLCSDGTSVGRGGPKCEFTACPINSKLVDCGTEVKYCQDGTAVQKTGLKCQFFCPLPPVDIQM